MTTHADQIKELSTELHGDHGEYQPVLIDINQIKCVPVSKDSVVAIELSEILSLEMRQRLEKNASAAFSPSRIAILPKGVTLKTILHPVISADD